MKDADPRKPLRQSFFGGRFVLAIIMLVLVAIAAIRSGRAEGFIVVGVGAALLAVGALLLWKMRRDHEI